MRNPTPAARIYHGTHETRSWCEHLAPGPCIESGVQRCRGGYERIAVWVPGLDYARKFMTAHVASWILKVAGPATIDEWWLFYCEVRASGLQLDHECENPGCRNPDHVTPRTQSENIMAGKDRANARWEAHLARVDSEHPGYTSTDEDEPIPF